LCYFSILWQLWSDWGQKTKQARRWSKMAHNIICLIIARYNRNIATFDVVFFQDFSIVLYCIRSGYVWLTMPMNGSPRLIWTLIVQYECSQLWSAVVKNIRYECVSPNESRIENPRLITSGYTIGEILWHNWRSFIF